LVWTTKYRYQLLGGDVDFRCRELLREIAISQEMIVHAIVWIDDHLALDDLRSHRLELVVVHNGQLNNVAIV